MSKRTIIKWSLAIVLSVIVVLCFFALKYNKQETIVTNPQAKIPLTNIDFIKAQIISMPEYYVAIGTVKPSTESKLEAQISARITNVLVNPGQKVKQGQLLIELDSRDYQAKLDQAVQAVSVAKAIYDQHFATYNRIKSLVKSGYASQLQFDESKSRYLSSQAELARSKKALRESQISLSFCQIKAPYNGLILDKYVDVGDHAVPAKVLLKLQTVDLLQIWANVPEELINKLRAQQSLDITIDAVNNKKIRGQIVEIAPNIDPQTRSFMVKVSLTLDPKIYPGMFGRVFIPVANHKMIIIPTSALIHNGQLTMVNIKVEDTLRKIIITTGKKDRGMIEVLSGLNGNEMLAVIKPWRK